MSSTSNSINHTSSTGYQPPDEMEIAKTSLRKRNVYDYNKMLEGFHQKDIVADKQKKKLKGLVQMNKKYKSQVQSMKNTIIQNEQDKIDKTKQELEEREKRHRAQQIINESLREEKRLRMNRDVKGEKARKKHLVKLDEDEEFRLREADRTRNKLNLFTEISLEHKLERHKLYEDKLRQSHEFHVRNLKLRDENYEKLLRERDANAFEKYTNTYFKRKAKLNLAKQEKQKRQNHLNKIQEMLEDEEAKRQKDRERFMEKLERMTQQRQALDKQKNALCEMRIEEFNRKFEKTKQNLKKAQKVSDEIREGTLEYQRALIFKGKSKEDATLTNRYLARENIVLSQMETEKKINQFNKDINKILDQSIMKKSTEQRQQIYKDILRAEAEKLKKEREEKKFEAK